MFVPLKLAAKKALAPLLFRYPPCGLRPERLMQYLCGIEELRAITGSVIEIGAYHCGTSILAWKMMEAAGISKKYMSIDTFGGFPASQFAADAPMGTPLKDRTMFADNSIALVSQILQRHNCSGIDLVKKDCTTLTQSDFPDGISVCLIDVDLSEPVRSALHATWQSLSAGGRIYVDDCPEASSWKAKVGVEQFCREQGVTASYRFGLARIDKS